MFFTVLGTWDELAQRLISGVWCLQESSLEEQREKHSEQVPGASCTLQGGDQCPRFQSLSFHKMVRASRLCSAAIVGPQPERRDSFHILNLCFYFKLRRQEDGWHWTLNSFLRFLGSRPGCLTNSPYYFPSVHFHLLYIKWGNWILTSKASSSSGSVINMEGLCL